MEEEKIEIKEPFTTTEWYRLGKGFVVNNYHVVSKEIDPYGKYNFDEIKAFCLANLKLENVPANHDYDEDNNLIPRVDRKSEIHTRLEEIDNESLRAVRATLLKKNTKKDDEILLALEIEAENLRNELKGN